MLLQMTGIDAGYGQTCVLHDVDLEVREGEIVALLGRNGVGKTTLLKTIAGLTRLFGGRMEVFGQPANALGPVSTARLGVSLVPDHRGVFPGLTVAENLRLAREFGSHGVDAVYDQDAVLRLFPRLRERAAQMAGTLSGGERQMLAIGRALLTRPRLLLIDELSEGIQPSLVEQLAQMLVDINTRGIGIVVVEQNVDLAITIAHRCYIVEHGQIVTDRPASELREDKGLLRKHMVV